MGGIRRRVAGDVVPAIEMKDQPFLKLLKEKWAKGGISAKTVEEFLTSASAQGASGLPSLSSPRNLQHLLGRQR